MWEWHPGDPVGWDPFKAIGHDEVRDRGTCFNLQHRIGQDKASSHGGGNSSRQRQYGVHLFIVKIKNSARKYAPAY